MEDVFVGLNEKAWMGPLLSNNYNFFHKMGAPLNIHEGDKMRCLHSGRGVFQRCNGETIQMCRSFVSDKVKKKYASLGHTILMVQLERSGQGLGLSLAGHKDRNCMAVFVCGINPAGAAHKSGGIQVGDEILEVRPKVIVVH